MKKKAKIIIVTIVGIIMVALLMNLAFLYDPDNIIIGNNLNSSMYVKEIPDKEFVTIEAAMATIVEEEGGALENMILLYQGTTQNLEKLFWLKIIQNGEVTICQIKGYEFLINPNGSYTYVGAKNRVFYDSLREAEYDWKQTVLADLSDSVHKSYRQVFRAKEIYGVLPAWGISDTEQIANMTIDGQKVDQVITFTCNDKSYYLWIIDDLQTKKEITDIIIAIKG